MNRCDRNLLVSVLLAGILSAVAGHYLGAAEAIIVAIGTMICTLESWWNAQKEETL